MELQGDLIPSAPQAMSLLGFFIVCFFGCLSALVVFHGLRWLISEWHRAWFSAWQQIIVDSRQNEGGDA